MILLKNKKDAYKIPYLNIIPKKYTIEEICSALDKIFEVHPILRMCISQDHEIPYLVKGNKPPVVIPSQEDGFEDILTFLTLPFDIYSNLSRYLIFEDESNYYLVGIFHHMIFDAFSLNIFEKDLMYILDGGIIDEVDDSFLKISAFHQQMQHSEEFLQITQYAESVLGNLDEVGFLLGNGKSNTPGLFEIDLEVDNDLLESFIKKAGISESILFTGAFAYTLSKMIGKDEVFFGIIENGRDRFKNFDNVGLFINPLPMVVNCKHPDTFSFMEYMSKTVYDMMNFNFYPFSLVALELGIEPIILFQYLPSWITGENVELNDAQSQYGDLGNDLVSQMEDFMVESLIEVRQRGKNYTLSILYSGYYSKELMEHLAACYKMTLSQILNTNP